MKKVLSAIVGVAFLAIPTLALAAPNVQNLTFSGSPNLSVNAGSSADATVWATLSGSDAINSVSYEFPGSGLPFTCVQVNPSDINPGQYNIDLPNFTVPNEAGNWDVTIKTYSDAWPSVDNNCDVAGLKSTRTFDGVVSANNTSVTTSTSNSTGSSTNSTNAPSWMAQLIASLIAALKPAATPAPVVSSACSNIGQYTGGVSQGSTGSAVVKLQGFLLSQGESIPALAAGASFGFFGPQTAAAVGAYKGQNNCQ